MSSNIKKKFCLRSSLNFWKNLNAYKNDNRVACIEGNYPITYGVAR